MTVLQCVGQEARISLFTDMYNQETKGKRVTTTAATKPAPASGLLRGNKCKRATSDQSAVKHSALSAAGKPAGSLWPLWCSSCGCLSRVFDWRGTGGQQEELFCYLRLHQQDPTLPAQSICATFSQHMCTVWQMEIFPAPS